MKFLKDKAIGGYTLLLATVVALVVAVIYVAFGISTGTFSTGILVSFLVAVILGVVTLLNENFFSDFLSIAMTVALSVGLALFARNSVGDVTEMITPVGMYGNADNVGMRFVIIGFILVAILLTIVEGFMKRVKTK